MHKKGFPVDGNNYKTIALVLHAYEYAVDHKWKAENIPASTDIRWVKRIYIR